MTRSPLAYPLNRSADSDVGGAADLQTDIMRFMAILSLCLVAIFALVQSIPLTPAEPPAPASEVQPQTPIKARVSDQSAAKIAPPAKQASLTPEPKTKPVAESVVLTRPKWVPKYQAKSSPEKPLDASPEVQSTAAAMPELPPVSGVPTEPEKEGFTLRFESDAALTRLVAGNQVGLYAIESNRAQRMTVSESRISFWDASTPNTFHEMDAGTVPSTVAEALLRTGTRAETISWGVTLPGKLKTELDSLMQEHRGGSLIIGASGEIRWEAS